MSSSSGGPTPALAPVTPPVMSARLPRWRPVLPDNYSPTSLYRESLRMCHQCLQPRLLDITSGGGTTDLISMLRLPSNVMGDLVTLIFNQLNQESTTSHPPSRPIISSICSDPRGVHIRSVDIRGSWLTDDDLAVILGFSGLRELSLSFCDSLTSLSSLEAAMSSHSHCLVSIHLEGMTDAMVCSAGQGVSDEWDMMDAEADQINGQFDGSGAGGESAPDLPQTSTSDVCESRLRQLTVNYLEHPSAGDILRDRVSLGLVRFSGLTYVDLSHSEDLGSLDYLTHLADSLMSLILHDVPLWENVKQITHSICQLKQLRHLDIGWSGIGEVMGIAFYKDDDLLLRLASSLPHLTSLDISGTDLAGTINTKLTWDSERRHKQTSDDTDIYLPSDIPGLSRLTRPLEFLGLLNAAHDACHRENIPALRITGDANESETLVSGQVYMHRPDMLVRALNDLFSLFRYSTVTNKELAKDIILSAMSLHASDKHIQISGSASLFYIVKNEYDSYNDNDSDADGGVVGGAGGASGSCGKLAMTYKLKRDIVSAILTAMANYTADTTMMRNGCLTLCHFRIPDDIMHEYLRLSEILISTLQVPEQELFIQRISIYLLNSLACQVDGEQKCAVGNMGIISVMLSIVSERLARKECDQIMEIAWSTMWNVTDETAINCKRFLDANGMELFVQCLHTFPDKQELLRNMLGLMGNVAEVKELRPHLMTESYINTFSELLSSSSDGMEVSYNSCGVLAHIMSDGVSAWVNYTDLCDQTAECDPDSVTTRGLRARRAVLRRMLTAIDKWDINSQRNINYRSFEPIMRLVRHYDTPECQHWACWAMANLTTVYPDKYCKLVRQEDGEKVLTSLTLDPRPTDRIKALAQIVLNNIKEDGDR